MAAAFMAAAVDFMTAASPLSTAALVAPVVSSALAAMANYNCGFGFDCGVYDNGYGYGGSKIGEGNSVGGGYSNGYIGGYVPDPEGAEIPPVIFPTNVLGPPGRLRSIRRLCGASLDRPLPSLG